jgi:N-acetylneuraminate synthase
MIEPITIGGRLVGPRHKPYIIAEAAINHQGDVTIAERMVYVAHALGVDAIKFQIHVLDNEMLRDAPQSDNFAEPLYDTLESTNLAVKEHIQLKKLCERLGIHYLCTPFSRDGADLLEKEIGVDAYKVGSGELTNLPLQEHIARKGKPTIVSTGMSTIEEIAETAAIYREIGTPFMLTHCISAYPAPYHIVNLNLIPKYQELFEVPVGLSDHSRGIYTSLGAVAVGAACVEKHFTLDKLQKGPDHASSLEPFELAELVKGAEAVFMAMGDEKRIFPEEEQIVAWARETVVSEKPILKGSTITADMVWVKRPSPGPGAVPAKDLRKIIGRVAKVDIPANAQILWEHLA